MFVNKTNFGISISFLFQKMEQNIQDFYGAKLSNAEFEQLSNFIYTRYGIKMPKVKKTMLQSRLHKRLRALNMTSFKEYIDFVFQKGNQEEIIQMIDVVSTNKTDFYREPAHFDFLNNHILPEFMAQRRYARPMKIWSAGCSSGEEPYTLAIVMNEFKAKNSSFDYHITATDISTRVLQHAVTAIYKEERVDVIPLDQKRKYLLRSKDRTNRTVRVVPALRKKVNFQRLNFMENAYSVADNFDIIFCRNVLIYFDRQTQENVINKICRKLAPDGYFFLGHSESITNMNVPLKQVKPTVFKRKY